MTNEPYEARQQRENRQAREAHRQWLANMTPDELKRVQAMKLDKFQDPERVETYIDAEAQEAAQPSYDPRKEADSANELPEELLATLRRAIASIHAAPNARLTVECWCFVLGLIYDGCSQTEIAKRHGISRAAVSKRCVFIANTLGFPPSHAMRKLTARKAYADSQHASRARRDASDPFKPNH